ncbi:type IV pilus modification protein PilV [Stenotrophomonas sp.]|uniref:type IV pilus modification protein PilV n=1 Tax=Stenotrophomonas sp. TaxID=69392 RepID=UPI002898B000|nr:type IV pilus modification protein PilV [Stenotrophomonas sp.]
MIRNPYRPRGRQRGFSLLEVLVAVVVLAFGLLGFALLQTMNVRYVQSANYRTQATNLAYDLTEQMRSNRHASEWYSNASFAAGTKTAAGVCARPINNVTVEQNIARWQCQVVKALGNNASANVTVSAGVATVRVSWADERWSRTAPDAATTFEIVTQL